MASINKIPPIGKMPGIVRDTMVTTMPQIKISGEKLNNTIDWIGAKCSSPENRLILGATALITQPFIDANNKKVDEETRKVSVARTIAKIIAGTLTGYFVRAGCIKLIDAFTKLPEEAANATSMKKWRMFFTPDIAKSGILKDLTHYKNAIGTILALAVMMFTNFAIDAPLTKYLTNKFSVITCKNKKLKKEGANE